MAEKVVKYFEDRVKSRVNTIYTITNYQLGRYVPITGLTGRKVAFKEFVIESEAKKASDSTQTEGRCRGGKERGGLQAAPD
jgi:hypothetical protein